MSYDGNKKTTVKQAKDLSQAILAKIPTDNNQLANGAGYQTASEVNTAIETAVNAAVTSAYKAGGSKTAAEMVAALLVAANEGKVYNVTEDFTTTADYVEGAGKKFPAGTNVAIINTGTEGSPAYKFDVMAGIFDDTATDAEFAEMMAELGLTAGSGE